MHGLSALAAYRARSKTFYVCCGPHPNDLIYAENLLEFFRETSTAARPSGCSRKIRNANCFAAREIAVPSRYSTFAFLLFAPNRNLDGRGRYVETLNRSPDGRGRSNVIAN